MPFSAARPTLRTGLIDIIAARDTEFIQAVRARLPRYRRASRGRSAIRVATGAYRCTAAHGGPI